MAIEHYKTPDVVASTYGPQYTGPDGTVFYPSCGVGSIATLMTSAQWTAATVSSTGSPALNNTIEDGFRMTLATTGSTAALIRQYAAMTFNRNWLPGKNSEVDWTKPFRIRVPMRLQVGGTGNGFKLTMFFGGLSAAPTVHTMSGKGINLCITGTAANTANVQICAHNGSTQVNSTASSQTFDGTLRNLDIWYQPGTGLTLMLAGVVIGTVASGSLPTGVSSSACGWAVLLEHTTATNGTSTYQQHPYTVDFLAP